MSYAIPVEVYEAIRKVVKDEELAKEVVKTIEKSLTTKLVTKEEFFGEIGKVRQEMETIRQELKGEIKTLEEKMKRWLLILGFLIVLMNQNIVTFLLKVLGV